MIQGTEAKLGDMTMATTVSEFGSTKDVTPELPTTASQAALQIDNFLLKESDVTDAVVKLSLMLEDTFEESSPPGTVSCLSMPGTVEIFGRALAKTRRESKVTTLNQLIDQSKEMLDMLSSTLSDLDRSQLKELRSFCANLSLAATDYLTQRRDTEPSHPYQT